MFVFEQVQYKESTVKNKLETEVTSLRTEMVRMRDRLEALESRFMTADQRNLINGERLRAVRKGKNMTMARFAEFIGCTPALVCMMEKGQRSCHQLLSQLELRGEVIPKTELQAVAVRA